MGSNESWTGEKWNNFFKNFQIVQIVLNKNWRDGSKTGNFLNLLKLCKLKKIYKSILLKISVDPWTFSAIFLIIFPSQHLLIINNHQFHSLVTSSRQERRRKILQSKKKNFSFHWLSVFCQQHWEISVVVTSTIASNQYQLSFTRVFFLDATWLNCSLLIGLQQVLQLSISLFIFQTEVKSFAAIRFSIFRVSLTDTAVCQTSTSEGSFDSLHKWNSKTSNHQKFNFPIRHLSNWTKWNCAIE